jgi:hypothetical protein
MRLDLTRDFYIPKAATKVSDKASSAVAYVYTDERGRPCARGFRGKAIKPAFNCYYRSPESRERHVREFFEGVRKTENWRAEQDAARKAKLAQPHKLQVGHILVSSWGYEQTNIDFYQVTALKGARSIELRKIGAVSHEDLHMQGTCTPRADAFIGEAFTKRVDENNAVRLTSYSSAYLWDGRPRRWTAYA